MKQNVMLTIASLLSLLLLGLHLTDDVVRGMFPGGIAILYAALVAGALLYAMLVLAERRSGQVIMLVVSLIAYFVQKTRVPGRRILDFLGFAPIAIPSVILGASRPEQLRENIGALAVFEKLDAGMVARIEAATA